MQIRDVKKQLFKRAFIGGILLVVSAASYFMASNYTQMLTDKQQSVQNELSALNRKISAFERQQKEYEEAKKLWSKLSDNQKRKDGLKIAEAQQLLDNLKNYYLLRTLKVNLSKPVELKDLYKTQTTVVISSNVTLEFEGLSDEAVFSFLGALSKYLPGYMTVKSFYIGRELGVSQATLEKLRNGTSMPMVKGTIAFIWRDLRDLKAASGQVAAPPQEKPPEQKP